MSIPGILGYTSTMTDEKFPDPLEVEPAPFIRIQITNIQELFRALLTRALPGDYAARRPVAFTTADFISEVLSPAELDRVNGFKAMKKQVEWICGRCAMKRLVRSALMPEAGLAAIQISYRPEGAPFLEALPEHCISLSHSNAYTAAAVDLRHGTSMGIDLEAIGLRPEPAFMRTAFTPGEVAAMSDTPREIFRHWTLKEAFLKYIGKGFNESLQQVDTTGGNIRHRGAVPALAAWTREAVPGYMLSAVFDPEKGSVPDHPSSKI